jgi:serine/threonine protein phosphatase 1
MRLLAIGDIHGCLTAFDVLLEAVRPTADDCLITLGDYVDRGPDSCGVLDRLIAMQSAGELIALRGNHDEMMLTAVRDGRELRMWLGCGGRQTLESYALFPGDPEAPQRIPRLHLSFLEDDCRDWYETDKHIFVHGCVYADLPLDEQPSYMTRWEKLYEPVEHMSGKVVVCGHTRQTSGEPRWEGKTIWLDTGAYDPSGWLTCADVLTGQYWQANQDGEMREGWLEEE